MPKDAVGHLLDEYLVMREMDQQRTSIIHGCPAFAENRNEFEVLLDGSTGVPERYHLRDSEILSQWAMIGEAVGDGSNFDRWRFFGRWDTMWMEEYRNSKGLKSKSRCSNLYCHNLNLIL